MESLSVCVMTLLKQFARYVKVKPKDQMHIECLARQFDHETPHPYAAICQCL